MILLIFKIVICSGLLLGFYYLFLEKQRTFKFNRVFLLSSLIFAYCIPFIKLNVPTNQTKAGNLIFGNPTQELKKQTILSAQTLDLTQIVIWIYVLITLLFLLKFLFGLLKLNLLKGNKIEYKGHQIFLVDQAISPFSFLGTIYLSKNHINENGVDERIFLHEKFHVDEKHSFDILFVEILKIFSWFNPSLFFIKKAMITNHEFQADEYVLENDFDVKNYQNLILNEIAFTQKFQFTHQFNFNNTKKRFIMMTTKNSRFSLAKKLSVLPLIAILFLLFSRKVEAQNSKEEILKVKQDVAIPLNVENVTVEDKGILKAFKNPVKAIQIKLDTIKPKFVGKNETDGPPPPPPSKVGQTIAEFPGGINELRRSLNSNFDTSVLTGNEGLLKSSLNLTINAEGKVINIVAKGDNEVFNKEAERAMKIANGDKVWIPATEKGIPKETVFYIPMTMQFAAPEIKK
ncbi:hypothetical protein IV494_11785 [Kaistella sp. G5-32]|uniref:Peptidase M56 domain-containing protein n=1 Tax=Kaistella gelatinilytica TaxID=2787636 RepID=A0ABS0FDW6_9FLAO|nr:M56 family metallopeptidase [Kaistella gelatinilytica]MBF8457861.1 hypothetical protein [Kaistella gelatinilytica]